MIIMIGIDVNFALTSGQLDTLKQNGVRFIGRYLGFYVHGWSKGIKTDEANLIANHGVSIVSIYEGNPTQANYFTYNKGLSDVQNAVKDAQILGQPTGTAIYFTVDYDAQPEDMGAIGAYFQGLRDGISDYHVGAYGGIRALQYLSSLTTSAKPDYYWQTAAWSNDQVMDGLDLYQKQCDTIMCGVDCDINESYASMGEWPSMKKTRFSDVEECSWYETAIAAMDSNKIMTGYSDGTFRPDQPMTRGEVASALYQIMKKGKMI